MEEQLWCCRIDNDTENIEMTEELLSALELDFNSIKDLEKKTAYHVVYSQDLETAQKNAEMLRSLAPEWKESMDITISGFEIYPVKKEDWSESWKKHFSLIRISDRLLVKPDFIEHRAAPGEVVVHLNPGMSFGTGQHPTTSFCLKMIDSLADGEKGAFLDAGCGSGILAIAAAKLGYSPVDAFDIDPDAIRVADENIEHNGLKPGLDILTSAAALEEFHAPRTYKLIAANILSGFLIRNREKLHAMTEKNGHLILAGILSTEYPALAESFKELGMSEVKNFSEKEWTSGLFRKD